MGSIIVRLNEGNAAVGRGLQGLVQTFGFPVVTESDLNNRQDDRLLSNISDDKLVIHGHGSTTRVGRLTVRELAKLLVDNGLSGPVEIELYACRGGQSGAPYALELKIELVQGHKVRCSSSGAKGVLCRNRKTGAWSVKDASGKKTPLGQPGTLYATTKSF